MTKFNVYEFLYETPSMEDVEKKNTNSNQNAGMEEQNPQMAQGNQENDSQMPSSGPVNQEQQEVNPFRHVIGSTVSDMNWKQTGQDWVLTIKITSSNIPITISSRGGTITASGPVPKDPRTGKQVIVLSGQ